MKKLIFSIVILIFSVQAFSQCADDANVFEFTYNGKVYEVIKEKKSWADAAACAVERGGYLVEINDGSEQSAVHKAIIDSAGVATNYTVVNNGGGIAYVWIGATDAGTEGKWLWDGNNDGEGIHFWSGQGTNGANNGEAIDRAYINWGGSSTGTAKEPDNWSGQDHGAIGLAAWPAGYESLGNAGEWNDIIGSSKLFYVIEYDSLSSGVNIREKPEFKIYPNPTTGILNVRGYQIESIEIIDFTGKTVEVDGTLTIDLSDFNRGIYFIKVKCSEGVITRKIILQ